MTPDAYCRDKATPPGSSLYYSLFSLPDPQRRALTAVYALRREMAELAAGHDPGVVRVKLDWWGEELQRLLAGQPRHPVTQALAAGSDGARWPRQPLQDLLDGAAMDLAYRSYPDFAALSQYCRRMGGAVNRLTAAVVDPQAAAAEPFADALGVALELTRILRNVLPDARQGRRYLPEDELRRHGVSHADLLKTQTNAPLRDLFRAQISRIRDCQRQALEQLPKLNRYAQRPVLIRLALDRALLDEIEADGYRLLEQRISLTPLRKFWLAWRTVRRERRRQRRSGG